MADSGQSVITASGTAAGLTVSREVTVPNTGSQDFARTVDTFTNSTGSSITTTVEIVGDLGSGAATTVFATSDGTGVVSPADQWIGTDGGGTPAIIHYIHGPSGLQPISVACQRLQHFLDLQPHRAGRPDGPAGLFDDCRRDPGGGRRRGQRPGHPQRLRRPGRRVSQWKPVQFAVEFRVRRGPDGNERGGREATPGAAVL